ncbi:hypothetical protein [Staphylococcus massiliensis]|uniref:hypothetical protein n=1 Tax=Staphylococcus massiliensis TaxID=555791 RepID=UPI001EDCB342|nr:hypothetical protein [Staphylococcus massiliensis]
MGQDYILGLDIGITSVGYGLIDYHDKSVIDAGVRLFKEANVENNEGVVLNVDPEDYNVDVSTA